MKVRVIQSVRKVCMGKMGLVGLGVARLGNLLVPTHCVKVGPILNELRIDRVMLKEGWRVV